MFEKNDFIEGKVYFRSRYCKYPAVQLEFKFPSMTEQHHKEDCDVNIILQRYMKTGVLPTTQKTPLFGDFSSTPQDYASAVKLLHDAEERFSSLPAKVRERFGNDPYQLLQFLDNPANAKEAADLGLIKGFTVSDGEVKEVQPSTEGTSEGSEA